MFFCFLTVLASCKVRDKLNSQLAVHEEENARLTRELGDALSGGGHFQVMDWKTAVKLLEERNISLRRGRTRIADLEKERDEQWKTWLPRVGVYGNLFSSLSELGNLAFGDPSFSVIAPLNIPNPLTEQARAFENALSYLQAVDNQKLVYRRLVSRLYTIYSNAERLEERMKSGADRDVNTVNAGLQGLETDLLYKEQIRSIRGQMAQILNMPGEQLFPATATRPVVDYSGRIHKLVPGKNYGALAVRLTAYQIEGALLREKGIKLRKWPSFSFSTSNPALYDNRNDDATGYFDTEQISLFGSVAKSYEFTGAEAKVIKNAKENTQFVKENLKLSLDQEAREWERLRTRYRQVLDTEEIAKQRLERIRKSGSRGSAMGGLTAVRDVSNTLDAAKQSKEQLDLEIWVWDEREWK